MLAHYKRDDRPAKCLRVVFTAGAMMANGNPRIGTDRPAAACLEFVQRLFSHEQDNFGAVRDTGRRAY